MNRGIKGNANVSIIGIIAILGVVSVVLGFLVCFHIIKTNTDVPIAEKTVKTVVSEDK